MSKTIGSSLLLHWLSIQKRTYIEDHVPCHIVINTYCNMFEIGMSDEWWMSYIDGSHVRSIHTWLQLYIQSLHSIQTKERLLLLYTLGYNDFGFPHDQILCTNLIELINGTLSSCIHVNVLHHLSVMLHIRHTTFSFYIYFIKLMR